MKLTIDKSACFINNSRDVSRHLSTRLTPNVWFDSNLKRKRI